MNNLKDDCSAEQHQALNYKSPVYNSPSIKCYPHTLGVFEHDWYPSDTEQKFTQNLKKFPDSRTLNYYLENPIKYILNSDYFRTHSELGSGKSGNVFLGCSHTFGIGLHLEDTWAYKVNQKIGGEFYNLGIPGGSIQNIFINFAHNISRLNIQNVFIYLPHTYRYLYFKKDGTMTPLHLHGLLNGESKDTLSSRSIINYLSTEYSYLIYFAFLNAIENLCNKYKVNCYFFAEVPALHMNENWIFARDLLHFPPMFHSFIADCFLNLFDNNIVLDSSKISLASPDNDPNLVVYDIENSFLEELYIKFNLDD